MLGGFGGTEILVIALVLLVFFGAKKIPEMARGIGQGVKEFRKVSEEIGEVETDRNSEKSG